MMINKRLIGAVSESKKYIAGNLIFQWCSLAANITMMLSITSLLQSLFAKSATTQHILSVAVVVMIVVTIRFLCTIGAQRMGYLAASAVKQTLRKQIYQKLLQLGSSYHEQVNSASIVQVAVEGVDQLEIYFSSYLPQFFFSVVAPLTLFVVLSFVNVLTAAVLFICVPLIPITIALVQTWAKKLLAKYWVQYTSLGDTFLENLQGLTTLKIYQADEFKSEELEREAEQFRKITMKVLTMQLNSITLMDLVAYGGAALGTSIAVLQLANQKISLAGCLLIILLSVDFFIPMRQLGSFFHIAMNGMAASDKIFSILDLPEEGIGHQKPILHSYDLICSAVDFSYNPERKILKGVNVDFPSGSFTAIVGASGSGKSTLAALLIGRNKGYSGSVLLGGINLADLDESFLVSNLTYISHDSYLFKGTIRENLLMGKSDSTDAQLWRVLDQMRLADFVKNEAGLETLLTERASNLSGGQRQRLALARAILHDSPIYIFDEAMSNIDINSERDILKEIYLLAKSKTVILISHRLMNVISADRIYVMADGEVKEVGTHQELYANDHIYTKLWNEQQSLEHYAKEVI